MATTSTLAPANLTNEQALELARAETWMGIADQNRALVCAADAGAVGLLVGVGVGLSVRKK